MLHANSNNTVVQRCVPAWMHTPAYVRLPAAISDSSLKKGRTTYETFQTALDVQRMKRTTNEPVDSCSTQYEQACKKKKNPQVKRSKHTRPRRNQRLQLTNAVFAQQLFNQNIGPSRAGLPANTTADRGERRHNSHKSAAEFPLRTHAPCASHTEACLNRKKKLAHA